MSSKNYPIIYDNNKKNINKSEFIILLNEIGDLLPDPLKQRVNIQEYADKILSKGEVIIARREKEYIGAILFYINNNIDNISYISLFGVKKPYQGLGIGSVLLRKMEEVAIKNGILQNSLHVSINNINAIKFYKSNGYIIIAVDNNKYVMTKIFQLSYSSYKTPIFPLMNIKINNFNVGIDIKYDGLYPFPFGGNKGRKAIYFLNYAKYYKYTHLITNGALDSNHNRAIAVGANIIGANAYIIIHDDNNISKIKNNINYKLLTDMECEIRICKKNFLAKEMENAMEEVKKMGGKPLYIWGGGHSPLGTMAYYDAFEEYICQINKNEKYHDYIFLPSGTGTTQAGLIAGNSLSKNQNIQIIGISISRKNEVQAEIIKNALEEFYKYYMIECKESNDKIEIIDKYIGKEYASIENEIVSAINEYRKYGVILDPVYTGKAFYGMLQEIKGFNLQKDVKVLFWHTVGFMNYISYKNNL